MVAVTGSAQRGDVFGPRLQCLHQPTPGDFGQQRVDGFGGVQIGLDEGDQPHRAVPGFGAIGVVQQDQAAERVTLGALGNDLPLGTADLGAERIAVRREPLRWADRAELDLRPDLGGIHRRHRLAELCRLRTGHGLTLAPPGGPRRQARRAGDPARQCRGSIVPVSNRRQLPEAPYLAAATGRTPAAAPVWFMRQAGRSLPEYRALRAKNTMMEACFNAELICEITLQPVRRHGVDAAILFSDIVVPLRGAGYRSRYRRPMSAR